MSLKEVLAELQRNYLQAIPDKIILIETLYKNRQYDLLETEYHKLKGTGRTYGLPEVTLLGAALERLCETDRERLQVAVPLSLKLLHWVREKRVSGEAPTIESESDFRQILTLVESADRAASQS
jgi:HPt (histidine-containing phosphotransfer) domain-containing protein